MSVADHTQHSLGKLMTNGLCRTTVPYKVSGNPGLLEGKVSYAKRETGSRNLGANLDLARVFEFAR